MPPHVRSHCALSFEVGPGRSRTARSRTRSDLSRILADRSKVDSRTVSRANPALSRKAGGPVGSLSIRPKVDSCTVSRANPTCPAVRSESRTTRASLRLEQASILGLLAVSRFLRGFSRGFPAREAAPIAPTPISTSTLRKKPCNEKSGQGPPSTSELLWQGTCAKSRAESLPGSGPLSTCR